MPKLRSCTSLLLVLLPLVGSLAQTATITGSVKAAQEPLPFAVLYSDSGVAVTADIDGNFVLEVDAGVLTVTASYQGYRSARQTVEVAAGKAITVNFDLIEDALGLEEVVVSATRNRVERYKAPVVVSTLRPRLLTATQSISLADGLNYAPGVRVETNCQNCGFTQVRLNGLDGPYTQILLNSRPVFTSLLGVYGLEQIPTNTIERVEVVRSGGSALYGSNAIAGTVNVITKDPVIDGWEVGTNLSLIDGDAVDRLLTFNGAIVADDLKSGATLFGNYRSRDAYDANGDGFTELVELQNNTIGAKAFYKPSARSKISANLNVIREYRRGGDRLDLPPFQTDITEELDHDTFIGGADFEHSSKDKRNRLQVYTSGSYTNRDSYYGGLGGGRTREDSLLAQNAFGKTRDLALVNGAQFTREFSNKDVLTAGVESIYNNTEDEIAGYNRLVDQQVHTAGLFGQYEWKPAGGFTALIGARLDQVVVDGLYRVGDISRESDISQTAFSPRITLAWQANPDIKLRAGYARGFRAPQAFNEDLHISSVGGEQQFVILSEDLETEYSDAFTASANYSKTLNLLQLDFLLEGFYTSLQDPFTQVSTGAVLPNGSILQEVRNGVGARVFGANFELGVSPDPRWQLQFGGTLQELRYKEPQLLFESDGRPGETDILIEEFVRTPNLYGYLNAAWIPGEHFNIDLTGTYTGPMTVPLVISDSGFIQLNQTQAFFDLNLKLETHIDFSEDFMLTVSGGVKNMFNSYQNDFDTGPGRDSDYVYGPALPRTFFLGVKFGKLH